MLRCHDGGAAKDRRHDREVPGRDDTDAPGARPLVELGVVGVGQSARSDDHVDARVDGAADVVLDGGGARVVDETSKEASASAPSTLSYTSPVASTPVATERVVPAARRDTPATRWRSGDSWTAERIGGAAHPVTPAKQMFVMGLLELSRVRTVRRLGVLDRRGATDSAAGSRLGVIFHAVAVVERQRRTPVGRDRRSATRDRYGRESCSGDGRVRRLKSTA